MLREEGGPLTADDIGGVVPEEADRGVVPDRDPIGGVDAEHRVAGRVHEGFEQRDPHRCGASRAALAPIATLLGNSHPELPPVAGHGTPDARCVFGGTVRESPHHMPTRAR